MINIAYLSLYITVLLFLIIFQHLHFKLYRIFTFLLFTYGLTHLVIKKCSINLQ